MALTGCCLFCFFNYIQLLRFLPQKINASLSQLCMMLLVNNNSLVLHTQDKNLLDQLTAIDANFCHGCMISNQKERLCARKRAAKSQLTIKRRNWMPNGEHQSEITIAINREYHKIRW